MATTMQTPARSAAKPSTTNSKTAEHCLSVSKGLIAAAIGNLLLYLAFPPLGWWPLAWAAPVPWLWLIGQPLPLGKRGYWTLWLTSFGFWAALLYGISLAHVLLIPGWLVLTAYLGIYLPLFVGMTRMLVHRWRWPLTLAAPLTWVGLEYARAYMVTGFAAGMLSQTQTPWPLILQTADIFGAYGVSFLMMLVAANLALIYLPASQGVKLSSAAAATIVLLGALTYGAYRMQQALPTVPMLKVMLVQGSQDTVLDGDADRPRRMEEEYCNLTFRALAEREPVDLVIWPESSFIYPAVAVADPKNFPETMPHDQYEFCQMKLSVVLRQYADEMNRKSGGRTSFLAGGNTLRYFDDRMEIFNTALLVSPEGKLSGSYFKNHLVLCGEYMPLGEWLPIIYRFVPIQGLSRGREFAAFQVGRLRLAPNICFESVMPQVMVRQHNELAAKGEEPDLLVNTTNDGWFYGSSILDIHFQCAVLRAIENRKPMLIAANTGISGVIDGNGRVLQRGPKREPAIIVAEVKPDGRRSLFHTFGDWPAGLCLAITALTAIWGWRSPGIQSSHSNGQEERPQR
jgi:apolipoprotein N-acyltransferase